MGVISTVLKSIYSDGRWFNFGAVREAIYNNDGYLPWPFSLLSAKPRFNDLINDNKKLTAILRSPALLKVFCLQCDLFSLGKIEVYDKNGKLVKMDPALDRFYSPNPFQTSSQFKWDLMFWVMFGNAYLYMDEDIPTSDTMKMYFLEPDKMEWPAGFDQKSDRMVFSKKGLEEYKNVTITYKYNDGSTIQIPLSRIICISDLTNGLGNWFKGPSRIDALYKIVSNSEATLDSENINLRYSGKFLVAGTSDPNNVDQLPMGDDEKTDIETKMNGSKKVHAVKSMIEIKRFVSDMRVLQLPEMYREQLFRIGNEYGIPKDVLEASIQGATFENQEKARGSHVSYTLQPKGNDFMERIGKRWGYPEQGKTICMTWDYLPFMQVFAKDKASVEYTKTQSLTNLLKLGVSLPEANTFLGTDFKTGKYERPKQQTAGNAANSGQSGDTGNAG